jgi:hypothetical protein
LVPVSIMDSKSYKIRKSFVVPLSVDAVLLFLLLVISLFTDSHPAERIVLTIILIPLIYVLIEVTLREAIISDEGIKIKKFLRKKSLDWQSITNVDTVIVRKKVFLALTTTKGFHILSNSYGNFTNLVKDIISHAGSERVEERVKDIVAQPIRKISDIVGAWVAALLLIIIIYIKLFST